jgi:tetratricopeptide (TPR) repeat protein
MGAYDLAVSKFHLVMTAALRLPADNLGYYQRVVLTAQSEIAETHYGQGKYKDASEFYDRLLKNPSEELNQLVVNNKLIRCLSRAGQHLEVVKRAAEFLNTYADSEYQAEVRYSLALAHKALDRKQEALHELLLLLEAVDSAKPEFAAKWKSWKMLAGNEIGNQLFLGGGFLDAIQVYKGLLNLDNSVKWKIPIHYQIGLCFERELQPVEAVKAYGDVIAFRDTAEVKSDPNLQMVVDMAQFRHEILSWKNSVEQSRRASETKVAEKTK